MNIKTLSTSPQGYCKSCVYADLARLGQNSRSIFCTDSGEWVGEQDQCPLFELNEYSRNKRTSKGDRTYERSVHGSRHPGRYGL